MDDNLKLERARQEWLNNYYVWAVAVNNSRLHIRDKNSNFDTLCDREVVSDQKTGRPVEPHISELRQSRQCKACLMFAKNLSHAAFPDRIGTDD